MKRISIIKYHFLIEKNEHFNWCDQVCLLPCLFRFSFPLTFRFDFLSFEIFFSANQILGFDVSIRHFSRTSFVLTNENLIDIVYRHIPSQLPCKMVRLCRLTTHFFDLEVGTHHISFCTKHFLDSAFSVGTCLILVFHIKCLLQIISFVL